jgi:DNA-binding MarR family transcriptional regulator
MKELNTFTITIDHVPEECLKDVTKQMMRVLKHLIVLKNISYKRRKDARYAINPSQDYLSRRLGIERSYVSKCLKRLEILGLITIKRSRKACGKYFLNKYNIGSKIKQVVKSLCEGRRKLFSNRVPKSEQVVKPLRDNYYFKEFVSSFKLAPRKIINKSVTFNRKQLSFSERLDLIWKK